MSGKQGLLANILLSLLIANTSIIGLPEKLHAFTDDIETKIEEPSLADLEHMIESGSYRNARLKLTELIKEKPNDVNVRLLAGRLYRQMGLWSLSLVEYDNARRMNPELVEPYVALSEMHLENLSVDIALATAREAVDLAPYSVRARQAYISALIANHNLREADSELKELLDANPGDGDVLYLSYKINREMGELQRAKTDLKAAMKLKPQTVAWYLDMADICEANGDYKGASRAVDKYLAAAPDSINALSKQAEIYEFRLFDLDAAKKVYAKMLEIEPDNQTAMNGNDRILKKRNDIAAAIKRWVYRFFAFVGSLFASPQAEESDD